MDAGAAEDIGVEDMVVAVVVEVVAGKEVVERAMVIAHMNFPSGTEHSCQKKINSGGMERI